MNTYKQIFLGVNIDHVATLRQTRHSHYPDPIEAALLAEAAGADGITVHLREDRRHIQERDVELLKQTINTRLNLEMAVTDDMIHYAEKIRPQHCCFVPEKRQELTTEGGLDVHNQLQKITDATKHLQQLGIEVSLFIDADPKQAEAAFVTQAKAIEIHTGQYAEATHAQIKQQELQRIFETANLAAENGVIVNAGHGLNYHNVIPIAAIPQINELNIGHGIIARAVMVGMSAAVITMKQLMLQARQ